MSAQIDNPRLARPPEDCYMPESVDPPVPGGERGILRGTQLTLHGHRSHFWPECEQWTYPDYRQGEVIELMNGLRRSYLKQLKGEGA